MTNPTTGFTTANLSTPVDDQIVSIVSVDPPNFLAVGFTRWGLNVTIDTRFHVGAIHVTPSVGDQWVIRRESQSWVLKNQLPANGTELLAITDNPKQGTNQIGSTGDNAGPLLLNGSEIAVNGDTQVNGTLGVGGVTLKDIDGVLQQSTDGGETYTEITGGGGTIDVIPGLQDALDAKVDENTPITGATHTKITYDFQGLVTDGEDAQISDIPGLEDALAAGGVGAIVAILTTKGDLLTRTPAGLVRRGVGAAGTVLQSDPAQIDGLNWGALSQSQIPGLDASKIISGLLDVLHIPGFDASKIISGIFAPPQIPALDATQITSGFFSQSMINGLLGDLGNIFNTITSPISAALLQNVPISAIGQFNPEMLTNPHYDTIASVAGGTAWTYDPAVTHTADGTGSAKVTANGTTLQLLSDPPIPVSPDQVLACSHWLEWSGVSGTGVAFTLSVAAYLGTGISNTVDLQSISGPAASSGWVKLSGNYTVPPTGVDSIRLQLTVTSNVLAGLIHWDDGSVKKTQLLKQDWTTALIGDLNNLLTGIGARTLITDTTALLNTLGLGSPTLTAIANRLANIGSGGAFDASQLGNTTNIPMLPHGRIFGIGGIGSIGAALQQTWDMVSGASSGAGTLPAINTRLGNLNGSGFFNASSLFNILGIPLLPGGSIPALDATHITSGVFGLTQIPTNLFGLGNIADLQSLVDKIANVFNPGSTTISGTGVNDAQAAMTRIWNTTIANALAIQEQASTATAADVSGVSVTVNFNEYANSTTLPAIYTTTSTGPGTTTLGVQGGHSHFYTHNDGAKTIIAHHNTPTETDYQLVTSLALHGPEGAAAGYVVTRCNTAHDTYVYLKVTLVALFFYQVELGCYVGGTKTVFIPATNMPTSANTRFLVGTPANVRNFQLYVGTKLIFNYTDSAAISQIGVPNRYHGIRGDTNGFDVPSALLAMSVADNMPPVLVGSGGHMVRVSSGTVSMPGGGVGPGATSALPINFFDSLIDITTDMNCNVSVGAFEPKYSGWYSISGSIGFSSNPGAAVGLVLFKNGSAYQYGNTAYQPHSISGNWVVYLNPTDYVQLGTYSEGFTVSILRGDSIGAWTYFTIALANRSYA